MLVLVDATEQVDKGYELVRAIAEIDFIRPNLKIKITTIRAYADDDNNTIISAQGAYKRVVKTKIPFSDKMRRMSAIACQFAATTHAKDYHVITESVFIREYIKKTVHSTVAEFIQKVLGVQYPEVEYVDPSSSVYVAKFCSQLALSKCCIKNIGKMLQIPEKRMVAIVRSAEFERRTRYRYDLWVGVFEKI
jgi:transcription initiation factor TFIIIB Brf1 subunit/transcription initiation factor TFIIB